MCLLIEQYLPTFLAPCIRCIDHLRDSHALSDMNQHLFPALLQNVDLLWRHRLTSRPLATVTSQWPNVLAIFLWTLSYCSGVGVSNLMSLCKIHVCAKVLFTEIICGSVDCLANDVIINWRRTMHTTWIEALIMILQCLDSMRAMCGFSTEITRNLSIWRAECRNYVN